jgi:hypothetical protein
MPVVAAMRLLGEVAPTIFAERMAELAYLANVLVAGAERPDGGRFRPAEAATAALWTVALGAELEAESQRGQERDSPPRATVAGLVEVLRTHSADRLFRQASATSVARDAAAAPAGLVLSRAAFDAALLELMAEERALTRRR